MLARLRSAHIVAVHDFDKLSDGRMLLVMDWVDGSDLAKLMKKAEPLLAEQRVVAWMLQVCEGMQTVLDQGIVHRDIKPSNILIDANDGALVVDFGLARSVDLEPLTIHGHVMGTPLYMAPEQADDPSRADARTDVYSFGATFYHVLTGQPPFKGNTPFSVLFQHKTEPLISPKARNPALNGHVSECLERCMAKRPQDRFQSFSEVFTSLQELSGGVSPWEAADGPEVHAVLERYQQRRDKYLGGALDLDRPDRYRFPRERELVIGVGDIAAQEVDAVVSSDDDMLSMGGGVSWALSEAAGPQLLRDAQRFAPVRPGRTIATRGGALPARFVFHGVTMGFTRTENRQWLTPSRDIINEIMENCFHQADTLGVQTIAFPLLGTGSGGFPQDVCLDTMFRFLVRKLLRGLTTVREARIVLFRGARR